MNNKEFELHKKLLELKHECKMKEIAEEKESKREIESLRFDHEMQLQRIKSAEIRKNLLAREHGRGYNPN